ncbi:MAG: hypothetical protein GW867_11055, partial [Armatimonadetes bacterium]|nr:hypothetical protein [Armatimonadota bacterium]
MNVGLSWIITPREWSFEETAKQSKAAGYDSVEVVIRDDWGLSLDTSEAEAARLAGVCRDLGLELASLCPSMRGAPKDVMTNED